MTKLHTHYDNLKVARDAPPEVIRAAYKSLAQKYHPDRRPGDTRAAKVMALLNQAYAVLSDPGQRRDHDAWISGEERRRAPDASTQRPSADPPPHANPGSAPPPQPPPYEQSRPRPSGSASPPLRDGAFAVLGIGAKLAIRLWPITLIGVVLLINSLSASTPLLPGHAPYTALAPFPSVSDAALGNALPDGGSAAATASETPAYSRPALAPDGKAWPTVASYLVGAPRLDTDGLSKVTVDNQQNDADVLVKLVEIAQANAHPVRTFFIPAHREFTAAGVAAGHYDIRYRDLGSGHISRSESFDLTEEPTADGTRYSTITITLYKVTNGNMQTYDLAESEF